MRFVYFDLSRSRELRINAERRLAAVVDEYLADDEKLRESGQLIAMDALKPSETAVVVHARNGRVSTSNGPFVETKEHLMGVYIVDVKNLDEAIRLAAEIPAARIGHVEIRPVRDVRPVT